MRPNLKPLFIGMLATALVLPALAGPAPVAAKSLMETSLSKATKEKKNVLLIFHASWCGWCKRMDAMLESPQFKATFEKNFVITHVDVMENGPKKELENEGGSELMAQYGGATAGLPFFVILSPKGVKIGDSFLANKQNMGFPSEPEEVTTFMALLKKTAPKMTEGDLSTVETFLRSPKK